MTNEKVTEALRIAWDAYENGTPDAQRTLGEIIEALDPAARLSNSDTRRVRRGWARLTWPWPWIG